jgi:hypothetical protein
MRAVPPRHLAFGMLAVGVLLTAAVACSSDDVGPTASSSTTRPTSSTTQGALGPVVQPGDLSDCPNRSADSSPSAFDPARGTYAAQSLALGPGRQLAFDIIQWLSGDDADEAYFRESGDRSGAPNDYFIRNQRKAIDRAPVTDDAEILVLREDGYAASLHPVELDAVPTDRASRTFWLTFEQGEITQVCHQYRP